MPHSIEDWRQLAASSTRGNSDEALDLIARLCHYWEQQGNAASRGPYGVWHASAMVNGTQCNCCTCRAHQLFDRTSAPLY